MAGKRSIFEEVPEGTSSRSGPVLSAVGAIDRPKGARRGVRLWLIVLALLVGVMVLVGGLTRLTDSGLSITEWKPVAGALPPMSAEDWQEEFALYQETPEFKLQNNAMTLSEFKSIYWWEWGHRQLGRFIALVWALGFLGFLLARKVPPGWTGRLLTIGVLIGVQGAVGWWMVSSGLKGTMLDVASYRLATHLGLAFAILGLITWDALLLSRSEHELMKARRAGEARLAALTSTAIVLIFLQIIIGALVAGIDAGRGYTDWPLMAGSFVPDGMFDLEPLWRNFFENDATVQFIHRMTGYLAGLAVLFVWLSARRSPHAPTRRAYGLALIMVLVQITLGVVTVMHSSPLEIAIFHQGGAILLLVLILRARHRARYPIERSLRQS
ncbi:heme A synthase [Frigidibacter sp. ROC022]|uniref:heme A synthase n=1 Tax=Frigidibacter sp. ROC022 TaxID=2971796 RepID=UPI00215AF2DF|nr:heme A synthase [Frigidibacter sp. ROC022]MCR8726343.1 COX15/CtaA family protein [Frigidibacter sp. ROC022]